MYKLNRDLLNLKFKYKISYDQSYRQYYRIKLKTELNHLEGQIYFMISRRYKKTNIYMYFSNGIYLKYPKQAKNHKEINRFVNKFFISSWKDHFKTHREKKISLGTLLLVLDKVAVECKLNAKKIKIMMSYVLNQKTFTQYDIFKILGLYLTDTNHITKELEPIIRNMIKYYKKFPSILTYEPRLNLQQFKYTNSTDVRISRISYEDFLETIEGFSHNDLLEILGNYKSLKEYEYGIDIKRILYRVTQKFK